MSWPVVSRLVGLFGSHPDCAECELCGDVDGWGTMGALRDGRTACWHCAERAGEFCIVEAGIPEWRGDHLSRCVVCRGRDEVRPGVGPLS